MLRSALALCLFSPMTFAQTEMKTVQHPAGLAFEHPTSWEVRSHGERIQLVPADVAKDQRGEPLEILVFFGEDTEGVTSVTDPRVAAYLETQLRQLFPWLTGRPSSRGVTTGLGPAAAYLYRGKAADGADLAVESYVVLHGGSAIVLVHAARHDLFTKRQPQVTSLFSSLSQSARTQIDPKVVSLWRRSASVRTGTGGGGGSISGTTWYYLSFQPDGVFHYAERDRMFGNTADLGVVVSGDSGVKTRKGKWTTSQGVLELVWEDGTAERFTYLVGTPTWGGTALKLTPSGTGRKPMFFDLVPGAGMR